MQDRNPKPQSDQRENALIRQRGLMLLLAAASYAMDSLVLMLYTVFGTGSVPSWGPWAYAAAGVVVNGLFYLAFKSGLHRRFSDGYLTLPQMFAAGIVQVVFAMLLPEAAVLFLMVLFVIMGFGGLRLNLQQIIFGWAVAAIGVGVVVVLTPIQQGWPHATLAEKMISALAMSLALLRVAYLGSYNHGLRMTIHSRSMELDSMLRQIERLATRDELTGALNRRSLQILLEEQLQLAAAGGQGFCVAMLDLDHFKTVNDTHGHLTGDAVLKTFSELASGSTRSNERVGRYGGEEFLAIMNTASLTGATVAMERIRSGAAGHNWSAIAPGLIVTVSIGVALYKPGDRVETLLKRADDALYRAKGRGRNQVVTELQ